MLYLNLEQILSSTGKYCAEFDVCNVDAKITTEISDNTSSKQTSQLRLKSCLGEMVLFYSYCTSFCLFSMEVLCDITAVPSENLGKICFL